MVSSKAKSHCQCAVCCQPFFSEQCIEFIPTNTHSVQASIVATQKVQGYDGVMQGGLITTLHDSAMLHCLFNLDITAMTASLEVRFHQSIPIGQTLCVQARWVKSKRRLHWLNSEIWCNGVLRSSASSRFMSLCDG
ncbi:PaaI family thioesterase [Vibrio scophthalmi]|uniref:Acyl-coenzyme A thioesterase THEM4 n=1 Tax=Vibrio scophthalmi TaxID=45658 RepID=A0A1E3WIZ7_9VIBR|nr:PaaI family thioesterase [Vibrio scophthalmi]ODS05522.1 hypothetical protein VSF3289_04663 [Vibrio scophthalmi]